MAQSTYNQELLDELARATERTNQILRDRDAAARKSAIAAENLRITEKFYRDLELKTAQLNAHTKEKDQLVAKALQSEKQEDIDRATAAIYRLQEEALQLKAFKKRGPQLISDRPRSDNDKDEKGKKKSIQVKAKKKPAGMDGEDKPSVEHAVDRHPFSEMLEGHDIAQVTAVTPANQQTLLAALEDKMQIIAGKPLQTSDATQVQPITSVRYNPTDDKNHHGLNEAVQAAVRNVSNVRFA